jgi:hypothetical protein
MEDEVTKAALEEAVEQLEAAESLIEALTDENERLKHELSLQQGKSWTVPTSPQINWNPNSSATTTHVALWSAASGGTQVAQQAMVNLAADTKAFKESMQAFRQRIEGGKVVADDE